MATYTIEIPDGQGARVVSAFTGTFSYHEDDPPADPQNEGQTLSPNEFAHQKIVDLIYGVVEAWEGKQAAAAARQSTAADVRSSIQITRA